MNSNEPTLHFDRLKQFAQEPDRVCASGREGVLTYRALYRAVLAYADALNAAFPGSRAPVLLIGDKENLFLAGILAVLFSGRPYVAVSSAYPEARIRAIAESCRPCAVMNFSDQSFDRFGPFWLDAAELTALAQTDPAVSPQPYPWQDDDLFAVFYTSGSTGSPKGVRISWRNIRCSVGKRAYLAEKFLCYGENEQPVILNFSSYGFIASTPMLFYDVCLSGAALYAVDRSLLSDYSALMDFICRINPSQFTCTPSFLEICLKNAVFTQENLPRLQLVFSGGGAVNMDIVRRFRERFSCELINIYGLTEATSSVLYFPASDLKGDETGFMPSGYALPETELIITDETGKPCPDGVSGELRVICPSVSPGYVDSDNQPFFTLPDGQRGYRTGDLFTRRDGLLYYMGRLDSMVKVGSYRVELFDVERNLLDLPEVKNAVVVPCRENGEVRMLTAFLILHDGYEPNLRTTLSVKKQLRAKIQAYAVPQTIRYLDAIPLNANAKPDRKQLEALAAQAAFGVQ